MGLYSKTSAGKGSFDKFINRTHKLKDFPSAELAKAKIVICSTKEQIPVQFNPQSLTFSGDVAGKETSVVDTESPISVDTYGKPKVTLSLELIFDATTDDGVIDHIKAGNFIQNTIKQTAGNAMARVKNGSKIFPTAYGDISKQVDFFYDILKTYTKRNVEFAWNQLSFIGDISSLNVNILLFDTSGNPIRAKISLTIKQTDADELMRQKAKPMAIPSIPLTRK